MSFVTGVKHVTMATLLARTDMVLGDLEHVAFDPTGVDGDGNPTGYTSAGRYQYLVDGWNRLDGPDSHVEAAHFVVRDGDCYYVEQPLRMETGTMVDMVYEYLPTIDATTSSHTAGGSNAGPHYALEVFENNPVSHNDGPHGFTTGWHDSAENSAHEGRLVLDFGEEVAIVGMEWQGQGNTGYTSPNGPAPISGPRGTTLRFSNTPFSPQYGAGTGTEANFTHEWANLNWGDNQSTESGLAEYLDLRALNGGEPIRAQYFAVDLNTSWDTRNMMLRHIVFHHENDIGDSAIQASIDDTVQKFSIRDGNGNFAQSSRVEVVAGTDTIRLVRSGNYDFVRVADKLRCYEEGTLLAEGDI